MSPALQGFLTTEPIGKSLAHDVIFNVPPRSWVSCLILNQQPMVKQSGLHKSRVVPMVAVYWRDSSQKK